MFLTRKDSGFTLVEVMVSLVIFLVASMGLLPLLLSNMQVNQGNSLHAQARRLAAAAMAELQVVDYSLLTDLESVPLLIGKIEVRQTIEPDLPQVGQSRLTVTAHWQQRGQSHDYQLQTFRSAP